MLFCSLLTGARVHLLSIGLLVTLFSTRAHREAGLCLQAASHQQHAMGLCQAGLLAPPEPVGGSWGADGGGPEEIGASSKQMCWHVFCMLQQAMCQLGIACAAASCSVVHVHMPLQPQTLGSPQLEILSCSPAPLRT